MPKVTILGAGITGMTIASQLPSWYDITIIAKDLPGDALNKEWASPRAAALWVGVHESTLREQQMQLDAFSRLWRLAETNPESSLRQTEMTEIMGTGSKSQVWYQDKVPDFRFLDEHELPEGSLYGMKYKTVVLTPTTFLPWMRTQLEARGVHFKRAHIQKLADLNGLGHDVLVNAAGIGPKYLKDVSDENLQHVRLQSLILKSDYDKSFIRRGLGYYSTAFSRLDGTVYIGGVIEYGNDDLNTYDKQRDLLIQRAHENNPDIFPSPDTKDYNIINDHVGRYPMRKRDKGGVRVEKEMIGDQKVVHAYGQHAGGYVFSFGLARVVANLVDEFLFESPVSSCL